MSEKNPTRRDLMRPVHLLGFALLAAVFAGIVTLVSMGVLQEQRAGAADMHLRAWVVAGIVAGITFIATLVVMALSLLAVDPAKTSTPVSRGVLLDPEGETAPGEGDAGRRPAPPSGH